MTVRLAISHLTVVADQQNCAGDLAVSDRLVDQVVDGSKSRITLDANLGWFVRRSGSALLRLRGGSDGQGNDQYRNKKKTKSIHGSVCVTDYHARRRCNLFICHRE